MKNFVKIFVVFFFFAAHTCAMFTPPFLAAFMQVAMVQAENKTSEDYLQLALQAAVIENNVELINQLAEIKGVDMKALGRHGQTLLHVASYHGNTKAVKVLLERDLDVNSLDDNKITPLGIAVMNGHIGVVELLLERKAKRSLKDDLLGEVSLLYAVELITAEDQDVCRQKQAEIANALIRAGERIDDPELLEFLKDIGVEYPVGN